LLVLDQRPTRGFEGEPVAKNDQDGRSLEEQLASLDALSNESAAEPTFGGATGDSEEAADSSSRDDTVTVADETPQNGFPVNPWLSDPPAPFAERQAGPYASAPPDPAAQNQGGSAPQPDMPMPPPPGYVQQPDYGANQQPGYQPQQYPPGNFYPAAPSAGSQPPPPLEPLPEYAPPQSPRHHPEAQQPHPWTGPAYEQPQGEAPAPPPQYGAPQPQHGAPQPQYGAPQPQYGEAPGLPAPYAPQPQPPQGEAPGLPALYAPQPRQGEPPGLPAPYAPPPPHGEVQGPPAAYAAPQAPPQHHPQGPPPGPGAPQPPAPPVPQTSDSLSADTLLRNRRTAPAGGWRRAIYKATAGAVHPGEAPGELRRRELIARARTPVAGGHHRVAVMSLKGGVGKTTSTVGLGATLASLRGDRVVAVDANPDRGTLSDKVRLETAATVRDLLNERDRIQRYADVRAFTSQASSRLEVLASDRDPAVSEAFSEDDYRAVTRVLEHYYSICLTDCGTGLLHSAMAGVLDLADQLVLVSSPSVDGARSASATLDWLEAHGHGDLVRGGVVVLSMVRSRSKSTVDLDRLQQHFESRCRAVVRIPYDPHLEEGAEVELDQLAAATMDAYLVLAAMIGDGFARQR
jgi:MinD-like ATPase involved in chromosome partitioning or flagellar assembly